MEVASAFQCDTPTTITHTRAMLLSHAIISVHVQRKTSLMRAVDEKQVISYLGYTNIRNLSLYS